MKHSIKSKITLLALLMGFTPLALGDRICHIPKSCKKVVKTNLFPSSGTADNRHALSIHCDNPGGLEIHMWDLFIHKEKITFKRTSEETFKCSRSKANN